jgi:hypothetical protein
MAVDIGTSVSAVEGIGPARAAALADAGVWTVYDLLRVPLAGLVGAAGSSVSSDEVLAWRRMAALLQVDEVTPQWAEALLRGGVETVDELSRRRLDAVDALMATAREQGVIPETPTVVQIAEMLKDAAVLCHTGLLAGAVVDPEGGALANATVQVGPSRSDTDEHGRFRVLRIPLGRPVALQITHADYATLRVEHPSIAADIGVLTAATFRMEAAGPETGEAATLSELEGDAIPATYRSARRVVLPPDQLRNGDILVVREVSSSAAEVQLVSRMKSFRDGELLVHTVRLPSSALPADVRVKDQFHVSNGQLIRVEMTAGALHRRKIRARLKKAFAGRPRPSTDEEVRALVRDVEGFLSARGYYRAGRGGQR